MKPLGEGLDENDRDDYVKQQGCEDDVAVAPVAVADAVVAAAAAGDRCRRTKT